MRSVITRNLSWSEEWRSRSYGTIILPSAIRAVTKSKLHFSGYLSVLQFVSAVENSSMKYGNSSLIRAVRCLGRSQESVRVSSPVQFLYNDRPPSWWISLVVAPWYSFNISGPLEVQFVITHSVSAIQPLCVRVPESYMTKFS